MSMRAVEGYPVSEVQEEPPEQQGLRELAGMAAAFLVVTPVAMDQVVQEAVEEPAATAAIPAV